MEIWNNLEIYENFQINFNPVKISMIWKFIGRLLRQHIFTRRVLKSLPMNFQKLNVEI
jgi:hypothetical protein